MLLYWWCQIFALAHAELLPALATWFGLPAARLSIREIFIVKYVAAVGKQQALGAHRDRSTLSFNLLLSDPSTEFDGGGTDFSTLGLTVAPGV
jgi:hypothetical protein